MPTPDAYSGSRGGSQHPDKRRAGGHTVSLADVTEQALLPTPNTMEHLPVREGEAYEKHLHRGDLNGSRRKAGSNLREVVVHDLLPTPTTSDANGVGEHGTGGRDLRTEIAMSPFGSFAPAIERWAIVLDREAPAPTRPDGKSGGMRLSPEFTEWMMGVPAGHITNPEIWAGGGLTDSQVRNAQLKACGNGVVPQQAALAVTRLLQFVPSRIFRKGSQ